MYSANVELSIWHSQIEVGDPNIGEAAREVVGPELVYCQDHNLLMYAKGVLPDSMTVRPHYHKASYATVDSSESSLKLIEYFKGGGSKRALGLRLVHASMNCRIYYNCDFFQRHKIIPTLFGGYLSNGGDILT